MEQLKQKLLQTVNSSNLPLEAIYYVVKDFYRDVDDTYQQTLIQYRQQQQMMQEQGASKEKEEGEE